MNSGFISDKKHNLSKKRFLTYHEKVATKISKTMFSYSESKQLLI